MDVIPTQPYFNHTPQGHISLIVHYQIYEPGAKFALHRLLLAP